MIELYENRERKIEEKNSYNTDGEKTVLLRGMHKHKVKEGKKRKKEKKIERKKERKKK